MTGYSKGSHTVFHHRYHFWGRGFFSTTGGNVTDEMINAYINGRVDAHKSDNENNITLE